MLKLVSNIQPESKVANRWQPCLRLPDLRQLSILSNDDTDEALKFLAQRPVHTVVLESFIRDHGIESPLNRGEFYGYRNSEEMLEGIALIGHTTIIEVHTDEALMAFAIQARYAEKQLSLVMSAGDTVERFWSYYAKQDESPKMVCTEILFELTYPVLVNTEVKGLRLATQDDLLQVAEAHAEVVFEERGVNPMENDREGFLERVSRRINKGKTYVVTNNGKLVFKADIVAENLSVAYLEGVYVAPEERGKGIGSDCLAHLGRHLLSQVDYVCLLSNVELVAAQKAYLKAGFKIKDTCQTIFV